MMPIQFLIPEIFLSLSIFSFIIIGVFLKNSFKLVNFLTLLSLIFGIVLVLNLSNYDTKIFNNAYSIDKLSTYMKVLALSFAFFVLLIPKDLSR